MENFVAENKNLHSSSRRKLSIKVKRRGKSISANLMGLGVNRTIKSRRLQLLNQMKGEVPNDDSEPDTQIDSLLDKYHSKNNENPLKRNDTGNLQEESIAEGEINREELPSFYISKNNINRMTTFTNLKIERLNYTPTTDLFLELKNLKNSSKRSDLLNKIVDKIIKGITRQDRKKFWVLICNLKSKLGNGEFEQQLQKPWECLYVIEKDAERTLDDTKEFEKGTKGYENLISVLHAISVYKQDITYVQGMNFIVGSLLDTFTPEESFWIFQFLLNDYKLRKMYTDNMPLLHLFSYQLRTLMELHLPEINSWLIENSLGVDIFWPQWFITLFSKNDNKSLFYQTVDLLLITGTKALFQIALSLLQILYEKGHLENFNFDAHIPTKQIIDNAMNFKVSNKLLKALEK